jgi:drug/metabolite transporter (DMT)-like permease
MIERTALFLAIVVLAGTGGEMAVSRAMKQIGEVRCFAPRNLLSVLRSVSRLRWLWIGIALMASAFFAFLALLSWASVSFVVPLTASSYPVGALGARFLLGERVTRLRWAGVMLVCGGVVLACAG